MSSSIFKRKLIFNFCNDNKNISTLILLDYYAKMTTDVKSNVFERLKEITGSSFFGTVSDDELLECPEFVNAIQSIIEDPKAYYMSFDDFVNQMDRVSLDPFFCQESTLKMIKYVLSNNLKGEAILQRFHCAENILDSKDQIKELNKQQENAKLANDKINKWVNMIDQNNTNKKDAIECMINACKEIKECIGCDKNIFDVLAEKTECPLFSAYKEKYSELANDPVFVTCIKDIIKSPPPNEKFKSWQYLITEACESIGTPEYIFKCFTLLVMYIFYNNIKKDACATTVQKFIVEMTSNFLGYNLNKIANENKTNSYKVKVVELKNKTIFDVLIDKFGTTCINENMPEYEYIIKKLETDTNFNDQINNIIQHPDDYYLSFWHLIHLLTEYAKSPKYSTDLVEDAKYKCLMIIQYLASNNIPKENCGEEILRIANALRTEQYKHFYSTHMVDRLEIISFDVYSFLSIWHAESHMSRMISIEKIKETKEVLDNCTKKKHIVIRMDTDDIILNHTHYNDIKDLMKKYGN
jgi:hypothetical protein